MKTQTFSVFPIVTCLAGFANKIGRPLGWIPSNPDQAMFLDKYYYPLKEEALLIKEISTNDTLDVDEMNKYLQGKGSSLELGKEGVGKELIEKHGPLVAQICITSILDLLVKWLKEGDARFHRRDRDDYTFDAVGLFGRGVEILQSPHHLHPIAKLLTQDGDGAKTTVFLTRADEPLSGFDLLEKTDIIRRDLQPCYAYEGVIFPMTNILNLPFDISWIHGISAAVAEDITLAIAEAKAESTLKMNEVGAKVKVVVAMHGMLLGAHASEHRPPPPLIIEDAFFIWFEREGLSKPLFVGLISEDHWEKPENLD